MPIIINFSRLCVRNGLTSSALRMLLTTRPQLMVVLLSGESFVNSRMRAWWLKRGMSGMCKSRVNATHNVTEVVDLALETP